MSAGDCADDFEDFGIFADGVGVETEAEALEVGVCAETEVDLPLEEGVVVELAWRLEGISSDEVLVLVKMKRF